ncbi:MAG TPA: nuclear transport factor 2 family protein [Caulobacteraceae bacterium]|jgi:hypothetical protein
MTPTEAEAFAPVATLLEGLASKDAAKIREVFVPEGAATIFRGGQFLKMSNASLAERLVQIVRSPDRLEEKMDEPLVLIDGNIAVVWGSYTAYRNGVPDHCGSNIISLIHEDGRWLIASVTDTSRSCREGPRGPNTGTEQRSPDRPEDSSADAPYPFTTSTKNSE